MNKEEFKKLEVGESFVEHNNKKSILTFKSTVLGNIGVIDFTQSDNVKIIHYSEIEIFKGYKCSFDGFCNQKQKNNQSICDSLDYCHYAKK